MHEIVHSSKWLGSGRMMTLSWRDKLGPYMDKRQSLERASCHFNTFGGDCMTNHKASGRMFSGQMTETGAYLKAAALWSPKRIVPRKENTVVKHGRGSIMIWGFFIVYSKTNHTFICLFAVLNLLVLRYIKDHFLSYRSHLEETLLGIHTDLVAALSHSSCHESRREACSKPGLIEIPNPPAMVWAHLYHFRADVKTKTIHTSEKCILSLNSFDGSFYFIFTDS